MQSKLTQVNNITHDDDVPLIITQHNPWKPMVHFILTNLEITGNTTFNVVTYSFQFTSSRNQMKNPFNKAVIPVKYGKFFFCCSCHDCILHTGSSA